MAAEEGDAGEVLSPWAQRFGKLFEAPILKEGNLRHSGLTANRPKRDPKFYADTIPSSKFQECGDFQDPNDIHRFFHTEFKHKESYRGMEEWQFGPLMQYVRFSDGLLRLGGHLRNQVGSPTAV
ncbi:hypothetical protein SAMD00023353_8500210 [Rosellinia necatrix]|uniref:Uncharacterized protein n=1 Tax=Rosellinia necatrix TaxID=77044 RepID=A0A1W2TVX2_ROSNE|nr:hypothetical protein SAMD00023353_8500210 [Rosellinia necatrix]